jgi:DNA-binding transcriptional LysR family regulator
MGVEPTHFGRALLKRSSALFNDLRTSVSELQSLSDPASGELRIGCSEVIAAGLLPGIIGHLSRQHPRLTLHVSSGDPSMLLDRDLRGRNIELIVGRVPVLNLGEDIEIETLFQDQIAVVAGLDNPLARRRKVTLEEIWSAPWCLPPRESNPGKAYVDFLHRSGMEYPKRCVVALSVQLQTGLLNTSDFLTLLPSSMLRFSADRLSIRGLRVDLAPSQWPVGIVTLKNRTLSPAAQLFIDCARSICAPLMASSP